jgi:ABC-type Fe3+ transport system substrate-binding protein
MRLVLQIHPDNIKAWPSVLQDQRCGGAVHRGGQLVWCQHQAADAGAVPQDLADLGNPMYKGKISAGRPDKSGSAFIQLALILQIYGEDKGWDLQQDPGQHRAVQQLGRGVQVCQ